MSTHRCPADDDAAIRNVLGLAALLNDEGDPEDQREVYAPDATWHLGDITRKGADEMVAAAVGRRNDGLLGPGTGTRHLMTLLTVEVADDTAKAVAYFVFVKGRPSFPAVPTTTTWPAPEQVGGSPAARSSSPSPVGTDSNHHRASDLVG
jgi:hypothetical protein